MERVVIAVILLTALGALSGTCQGFCLPPLGWHAKSLVERIKLNDADAVALALVDAVHKGQGSQSYTADLEVECFYTKGEGVRLPAVIKGVEGFGGYWDCASSEVEEGEKYIIFLNVNGDQVEVAEVNGQIGAEVALPSRMDKVSSRYQCKME